MLHTKFRGNRSTGSGDLIFEGFLVYMGVAAMLVMWPRLSFPYPRRLHIKFGFD